VNCSIIICYLQAEVHGYHVEVIDSTGNNMRDSDDSRLKSCFMLYMYVLNCTKEYYSHALVVEGCFESLVELQCMEMLNILQDEC